MLTRLWNWLFRRKTRLEKIIDSLQPESRNHIAMNLLTMETPKSFLQLHKEIEKANEYIKATVPKDELCFFMIVEEIPLTYALVHAGEDISEVLLQADDEFIQEEVKRLLFSKLEKETKNGSGT
jgi:hypothetical protein